MRQLALLFVISVFASSLAAPVEAAAGRESSDASVGWEFNSTRVELTTPVAEEYALDYDVSVEEAVHRMRVQDVVTDLGAFLESELGDDFTYLSIDHDPVFQVSLGVSGNAAAARILVGQFLSQAGVSGQPITIVRASVALDELKRSAEQVVQSLANVSMEGESSLSIDARNGRIILAVDEPMAVEERLKQQPITDAVPVEIVLRDPSGGDEDTIWGGLTQSQCTSGFTVVHTTAGFGVLTAGHCDNSLTITTPQGNSKALTYYAEATSGSKDVQWHLAFGQTFENKVKVSASGNYLRITSQASSYPIGTYLCKYGKTTGNTCGTIASANHDPDGWGSQYSADFVEVNNSIGGNLSSGGDSGAPWYSNFGKAYGIHKGSSSGDANDAVFTKIHQVASLGLTVKTS